MDTEKNASGPRGGTAKRRVLIVEDELFMQNLLKQRFENDGYMVETAATAEEAANILALTLVDLICLDLLLPGKDGFSFLKALKADDRLKVIPVFILSNLGQQEEIKRGLSLGAEDYLVKANVAPREIVEKINIFLNKKLSL